MKSTIHYVIILDQSGSMIDLRKEVVSSFNNQVRSIRTMKQNAPDTEIKCTLCMFNDVIEFRFINKDIDALKLMSYNEYSPDSLTALYDAIGASFNKLDGIMNPGDKGFVAIFTDGYENCSRKFSGEDIQQLFDRSKDRNVEVSFFCRNEDATHHKADLNLNEDQILGISLNNEGLNLMEDRICYRMQSIMAFDSSQFFYRKFMPKNPVIMDNDLEDTEEKG